MRRAINYRNILNETTLFHHNCNFSGKNTSNGQLYALKQERPPNLWEYYICLEIQDRISVDELVILRSI